MMNRVIGILGASAVLIMAAGPAFAGLPPVSVPEPATMSVMLVGVGAAFAARKFLGRK